MPPSMQQHQHHPLHQRAQGLLGLAPGLGTQSASEYAAAAAAAANYAAAFAAAAAAKNNNTASGMVEDMDVGFEAASGVPAAAAAAIAVSVSGSEAAASPLNSPNTTSSSTSPSSSSMALALPTSPAGLCRRNQKNPVPDHMKDARYFEKRLKNNIAAKKSRDARRMREKANELEKEKLEAEVAQLRAMVSREHAENEAMERLLNGRGVVTPENLVPEIMRTFKLASEAADPAVARQLTERAHKLVEASGGQCRRQRQMLQQLQAAGKAQQQQHHQQLQTPVAPPLGVGAQHALLVDELRRHTDT